MNKIVKIYAGVVTIIAIVFYLFHVYNTNKIDGLEEKITELSTGLDAYKSKLEKEHNDKVDLDKRYKKLEEAANRESIDWNTDISNDPVNIELRNQAKNHRNGKRADTLYRQYKDAA